MDPQPSPYFPAPEGAPPVPPRRIPRVAIAVGLTTLFGLAGAGLAFATGGGGGTGAALSASSSTSTPSTETPPAHGPKGKFGRPGFHFGGPGGFGGQVVHAEYTVKDGSGYKTYAEQVGQVQTVSKDALTVKSDDGYTQTYVVQAATIVDSQSGGISAVAGKDTVRIEALVSNSSRTATNIVDTTKIGASRKGFGYPAPPEGFQGGPDDPSPDTQAGPGGPPNYEGGPGTGTGGSIPT